MINYEKAKYPMTNIHIRYQRPAKLLGGSTFFWSNRWKYLNMLNSPSCKISLGLKHTNNVQAHFILCDQIRNYLAIEL